MNIFQIQILRFIASEVVSFLRKHIYVVSLKNFVIDCPICIEPSYSFDVVMKSFHIVGFQVFTVVQLSM
jgi:hypothetical protein